MTKWLAKPFTREQGKAREESSHVPQDQSAGLAQQELTSSSPFGSDEDSEEQDVPETHKAQTAGLSLENPRLDRISQLLDIPPEESPFRESHESRMDPNLEEGPRGSYMQQDSSPSESHQMNPDDKDEDSESVDSGALSGEIRALEAELQNEKKRLLHLEDSAEAEFDYTSDDDDPSVLSDEIKQLEAQLEEEKRKILATESADVEDDDEDNGVLVDTSRLSGETQQWTQ